MSALESDIISTEREKIETITWINNQFNAASEFESMLPQIQQMQNKLSTDQISIPSIDDINTVTSLPFVKNYSSMLYKLLETKDILFKLTAILRASTCSLNYQNSYQPYANILSSLNDTILAYYQTYVLQAEHAKSNIKTIRQYLDTISKNIYHPFIKSFWLSEHRNLIYSL
jgi:hypothetical protein